MRSWYAQLHGANNVHSTESETVLQMYRCWLVYFKSWRIVALPIMLWLACITCVILFNFWLITDLGTSGQLPLGFFFTPRTHRLTAVFFCCSFVNNVYATCMSTSFINYACLLTRDISTGAISYRILRVARSTRSTSLYIACRVIAESGILCASTTLLMLIISAVMNDLSLPEVLLDDIVSCMVLHRRCCFTLYLFRIFLRWVLRSISLSSALATSGRRMHTMLKCLK